MRLRNAARQQGPIKVWVTFWMDYQGDPIHRTAEVIAAEAAMRDAFIAHIIDPLESYGLVERLSTPGHLAESPGVMVRTNDTGLNELVESEDIQHIRYMQ